MTSKSYVEIRYRSLLIIYLLSTKVVNHDMLISTAGFNNIQASGLDTASQSGSFYCLSKNTKSMWAEHKSMRAQT